MANECIVKARGLAASVNGKVLIDGMDLDVAQGECVCVVGLNSAGKSVLLRVLSGLHDPTSGMLEYGGAGGGTIRVSGVWGGRAALYPRLTVEENCRYFARLGGMGRKEAAQRVPKLMATLGLEGREHVKVSQLSSGMAMRSAIAASLITSPDLLILDEPDSNQDDEGLQHTTRALSAYCRNGGALICASHNASLVENLADSVVGLRAGKMHFRLDREAFLQTANSTGYYVLELLEPATATVLTSAHPKVKAISSSTLLVPSQGDILMAALRAAEKFGIADLRLVTDPLERLFFQAEESLPC